jgi:hypothetical protein
VYFFRFGYTRLFYAYATGYEKMADVWYTAIFAITHPVADAGYNQSVHENDFVTLDASNSSDPDGIIDCYFWKQMPGGSQVTLSDPNAMNPSFTAPVGSSGETLTFQVTVTDDDGLESTDTSNVDVSSDIGGKDTIGIRRGTTFRLRNSNSAGLADP